MWHSKNPLRPFICRHACMSSLVPRCCMNVQTLYVPLWRHALSKATLVHDRACPSPLSPSHLTFLTCRLHKLYSVCETHIPPVLLMSSDQKVSLTKKAPVIWQLPCVDRGFCPARPHSHSAPKKYTEVYINYKLVGLVAQASY